MWWRMGMFSTCHEIIVSIAVWAVLCAMTEISIQTFNASIIVRFGFVSEKTQKDAWFRLVAMRSLNLTYPSSVCTSIKPTLSCIMQTLASWTCWVSFREETSTFSPPPASLSPQKAVEAARVRRSSLVPESPSRPTGRRSKHPTVPVPFPNTVD